MDEFRMIATVISMVLGLGVARLLLGLVAVFRARRQSAVDWVVLAWAAMLFVEQLQFWWAVGHLPAIRESFTFIDFLGLVALTLTLFLAAALLLPSRPDDEKGDLRAYFEADGRYGLLALAAFTTLAFFGNVFLFEASPVSVWGALDIPMIGLPVAAFFARSRRMEVWLVAAYVPISAIDLWVVLET